MIKLYIDKHAGFCSGVTRTLQRAMEISKEKQNIVSLGELIHNPVIIQSLENAGISVVNKKDEIDENNFVIVRAHGIPPVTENWLNSHHIPYKDLTCPRVKNIHKTINQYADKDYIIVIVGNPNHPEVIGHLGYASNKGVLITNLEEAENFSTDKRVVIIAQTTISEAKFKEIVKILKRNLKVEDIVELNTICSSVKKQQAWIKKYSRFSDASLIIGGKKSSNSEKLYNIANEYGNAFWIERADEITSTLFSYSTIALTAGASTPDKTIEEVLELFRNKGAELIKC